MKDTILLPKTDFPMKGDLPKTEPLRLEFWEKNKIYQKMVERPKTKGQFVMPDGPPYANSNIHLGTALNKILKDIVIKYRNMAGYNAPFIPGWDCHGLPIELKTLEKLGDKRSQMSDSEVRDHCRQYAKHWVHEQMKQFQRLGVLADWEHPYLTLSADYEAEEVRVLARVLDNGVLYRGEKPVYWCPKLQTALAAAEVEYHDHKSPSIYVKFPVNDSNLKTKLGAQGKIFFVIWTTTPWTLPANLAIALNPEFTYGVYSHNGESLVIATELLELFSKDSGITLGTPLKTFKGRELERMNARHPFLDRDSLLVLGDHVTADAGTGCVHTAPGHGLEDYAVGLKYGLPILSPVNEAGLYTNDVPSLVGTHIWKANNLIVDMLQQKGLLLFRKDLTHSYPHNPRTKTPLIFRATPQWFIKLDDEKYPVRKRALKAAEVDIQFVPKWGAQRLNAMVANSPDWCVSRQRMWGVPIPVFYCTACGEALLDSKLMGKIADLMESSGEGIEAYFKRSVSELIGPQKCQCGHSAFKKGSDILDVWFDSGVCHTAVQRKRYPKGFPADIYLEGSDQHRGWFQTSLISSIAATNEPPFKTLITHGFVNDAQGYKMSKSQGNVIDPADVIKKYGAEILRLWVAHEDYGEDVTVGEEMFLRITESYRRFRNTMRFLLGNLFDFDPAKDIVPFANMTEVDRWALIRLNELIVKVGDAYERYEFFKVFHALNNFFTVELSATYLDILKDRLYTAKPTGSTRRSSQTVLYHLLNKLCSMLAPLATFLADETYSYIPGTKKESVLLCDFPQPQKDWQDQKISEKFNALLELRSAASKQLEELRRQKVIGASLDAELIIELPAKSKALAESYKGELRELFIVSKVTLKEASELKITAQRAPGEKCVRCWHYSSETGKNAKFPEVCPKCVEALS